MSFCINLIFELADQCLSIYHRVQSVSYQHELRPAYHDLPPDAISLVPGRTPTSVSRSTTGCNQSRTSTNSDQRITIYHRVQSVSYQHELLDALQYISRAHHGVARHLHRVLVMWNHDKVYGVGVIHLARVADDRLQLRGQAPQFQVLQRRCDRRQVVTEARDGVDGELGRLQCFLGRLKIDTEVTATCNKSKQIHTDIQCLVDHPMSARVIQL